MSKGISEGTFFPTRYCVKEETEINKFSVLELKYIKKVKQKVHLKLTSISQ